MVGRGWGKQRPGGRELAWYYHLGLGLASAHGCKSQLSFALFCWIGTVSQDIITRQGHLWPWLWQTGQKQIYSAFTPKHRQKHTYSPNLKWPSIPLAWGVVAAAASLPMTTSASFWKTMPPRAGTLSLNTLVKESPCPQIQWRPSFLSNCIPPVVGLKRI